MPYEFKRNEYSNRSASKRGTHGGFLATFFFFLKKQTRLNSFETKRTKEEEEKGKLPLATWLPLVIINFDSTAI